MKNMSPNNNKSPSVYIIILNWNGWVDTIECLESLIHQDYDNFTIVVVDNGSENDSLDQITKWAKGHVNVSTSLCTFAPDSKPVDVYTYAQDVAEKGGIDSVELEMAELPSHKRIVIIENNENLGFAGGCNVGIRYAQSSAADYIWLLNNDTLVMPDALSKLVDFLDLHADYGVATAQIRYYGKPDVIWNCGGMLTWYGCRKYDYCGSTMSSVPESGYKNVTYITGCAALFRTSLFADIGILTHKYFFGEEDFEMALRIKKLKYCKQACIYDSIIYHKVGASIGKASKGISLGKPYVYYLNRFIDLKHYWPLPLWSIWRLIYLLYIIPLVKFKCRARSMELVKFTRYLLKESASLDSVTKRTFEKSIKELFPS